MSWCDKLASTPGVGFQFDFHFISGNAIFDAMAPLFDKLVDDDKIKFTIDRQEPYNFEFTTEDGFHYGVDPSKVFIEFRHRMRYKPTSGGLPTVEMLSEPAPFTELLPRVNERLLDAVDLILAAGARSVTRIGLVSTTHVAREDLPPGIERFMGYFSRPWGNVESLNLNLTSEIEKTPNWSDRCIHLINLPEDTEQLLTLRFDYQRELLTTRAATKNNMNELLSAVERAGLQYLEDLAEGSRFDETVIDAAT